MKPTTLKDEFKNPESQLFLAQHGNGCRPNSSGTKVYGVHLDDGEKTYYRRYDIAGAIKDACLPDWAREKLEKINADKAQSDSESPSKDGGMTMGGI